MKEYIRFLLGYDWNCTHLRTEGRIILIATWIIYLVSAIALVTAWRVLK